MQDFASKPKLIAGASLCCAFASAIFVSGTSDHGGGIENVCAGSQYFVGEKASDIDDRFRCFFPEQARLVRLRTYQSGWWITIECSCEQSVAKNFCASQAIVLRDPDEHQLITIPDHGTDQSELRFVDFTDRQDRWLQGGGSWGPASAVVAYDRQYGRLYFCKSSGDKSIVPEENRVSAAYGRLSRYMIAAAR